MLPRSFALSDDEESLRSLPWDDYDCCNQYQSPENEPICLNEYCSIGIELPNLSWCGYCNCPTMLTMTNTGESVSITGKWAKGRPYVTGGSLNGLYLFSQIHFHWPSDHVINGRRYDLEMHVVHYKAAYLTEAKAMRENDGTIVLVYLFEVVKERTCMSKITCMLHRIRNKGEKANLEDFRLGDLIKPFCSNYFLYNGSAYVSGSNYSLQWLISCNRLCISENELLELKDLFRCGAGDPFRSHVRDSNPTSEEVFLVGGNTNICFPRESRSEVKFCGVEEKKEEKPPEEKKSCCILAKWIKNRSSSCDSNTSSDQSSKSKKTSNSKCKNDKRPNDKKAKDSKSKDKEPKKDNTKKCGEKEQKPSKCTTKKSESSENTDTNSASQSTRRNSDKKKKCRISSEYETSSDDCSGSEGNRRRRSVKERDSSHSTKSEKRTREMGQQKPIIAAPVFLTETPNMMISIGTMTPHPPPPSLIRGTDLIGEGSEFLDQENSISCSQFLNCEERTEQEVPGKADKMINIPDHDRKEDLELLPIYEGVQEVVEEEQGMPPYHNESSILENEQSFTSVLASIAEDPSLSKIVADLSTEAIPVEEKKSNLQSLTKLLSKISKEQDLTVKTETKNENLEIPPIFREIYVQTESIHENPPMIVSDKSFETARTTTSFYKSMTEDALKKLTNCYEQVSKRSFIINLMTEMTKDPNLMAELVRTSEETSLVSMIKEALRDLGESNNEKVVEKKLSNPSVIHVHPVQSHTKTLSSVSNNQTEFSNGNIKHPTMEIENHNEEQNVKLDEEIKLSKSRESELIDLSKKNNSRIFSSGREDILFLALLSRITSDATLANDLMNIVKKKSANIKTNPSMEKVITQTVSKQLSAISEKAFMIIDENKSISGGNIKKTSEIELIQNESNSFPKLIEALLLNDIYENSVEKRSSPINEITSTSSIITSKQSLKRESIIQKNIINNQSTKNLINDQRLIMNVTSSKKRLLVDKIDEAITIWPNLTEILKNITLIDIIGALIKEKETADRSVGNRSFESVLSIVSRELSGNEIQSEKSRESISEKLKISNKSSKMKNNVDKSDIDSLDFITDIIINMLEDEKTKSFVNLKEKINDNNDNNMENDSIDKIIGNISKSTSSCKQQQSSIGDINSGNNSAADFLIELLEKTSSATEIAMTLKGSCMIKLLETVLKISTMCQSVKIEGMGKLKNFDEIELSADVDVVPENITKKSSTHRKPNDENQSENLENLKNSFKDVEIIETSQRRDQERNHVNFEEINSENSIATERPEVEKLHRQEDLNESIKSRRSTDTKRSGDDELDREYWRISEESVMDNNNNDNNNNNNNNNNNDNKNNNNNNNDNDNDGDGDDEGRGEEENMKKSEEEEKLMEK